MKKQTVLARVQQQGPYPVTKGSRQHNPKFVVHTHVNKGKKYPYDSGYKHKVAKREAQRAAWAAEAAE